MSVDLPSSDRAAVAVSIVVPVRNEAENVSPLIAEIAAALESYLAEYPAAVVMEDGKVLFADGVVPDYAARPQVSLWKGGRDVG